MQSARGQLLIAGPTLLDPNFWRTVVLVVEHTEEGALGLVLNRPSETSVGEAVPQLEQLVDAADRLYIGGPVQPSSVLVLAEFEDPGHAHGPDRDADRGALRLALALILGLMGAEIVAGILASSLALLSDAAHMLTDAAALALSLLAARLAARPAAGAMTYGLGRAEILSAQANGITLLVLAALIVYSAITRLVSPPEVGAW